MLVHPAVINSFESLERAEPILQDSTAMRTFKECDRKYFYRFVLGRIPHSSKFQEVLDFGKAYHKFRELLETHDKGDAFAYLLTAKLSPPDPKGKFSYLDRARLLDTCKFVYQKHWLPEKEQGRIKVIGVEQAFNVQLGDTDIQIAGRADQIIEFNGKIYDRDFKTTSKNEFFFQRGTDPSDQAIRYIYGLSRLHGQPIQGVYFEAIYQTKTVKPEIFTVPSLRTQSQLAVWEKEQIHLNDNLKKNRQLDIWPMRENNCGFCDYAKVCRLTNVKAQEAELKNSYKVSHWDCTKTEQDHDND